MVVALWPVACSSGGGSAASSSDASSSGPVGGADPQSGDVHAIARSQGVLSYYFKPAGATWATHPVAVSRPGIYVEGASYQTQGVGDYNFALCGRFEVSDGEVWHGRLVVDGAAR